MSKSLTSVLILVASFVNISLAIFFAWVARDSFRDGVGQAGTFVGTSVSLCSIILISALVFAWISYSKKQYQKVISILSISFGIAMFIFVGAGFMSAFATK